MLHVEVLRQTCSKKAQCIHSRGNACTSPILLLVSLQRFRLQVIRSSTIKSGVFSACNCHIRISMPIVKFTYHQSCCATRIISHRNLLLKITRWEAMSGDVACCFTITQQWDKSRTMAARHNGSFDRILRGWLPPLPSRIRNQKHKPSAQNRNLKPSIPTPYAQSCIDTEEFTRIISASSPTSFNNAFPRIRLQKYRYCSLPSIVIVIIRKFLTAPALNFLPSRTLHALYISSSLQATHILHFACLHHTFSRLTLQQPNDLNLEFLRLAWLYYTLAAAPPTTRRASGPYSSADRTPQSPTIHTIPPTSRRFPTVPPQPNPRRREAEGRRDQGHRGENSY